MIKRVSILFISVLLLTSFAIAQSSSYKRVESKVVSKKYVNPNSAGNFYIEYKNRQLNTMEKPTGATVDLIFANWDWPSNSWTPASSFAYDFTGDGALDMFGLATDNSVPRPGTTNQRDAVFAFIDDFGQTQYPIYGIDGGTGIPVRTGWNSHLLMDYATGVVYISIYDFLNSNGNINNHLWKIDLLDDPGTAIQLTDSTTALEAGWPRIAMDGNGNFWMGHDNAAAFFLNIAVSTDGGATFAVVDSVGSNDPNWWGTDFGNDPIINAYGDKISFVTSVAKAGDLGELYGDGTTSDPDSASGLYHWYSNDGGGTWMGEMIMHDGTAPMANRPTYELLFEQFDIGSQYVDMQGVTHVVHGGTNSAGVRVAYGDTSNVYPIGYWNDRDKNWISVELPVVEQYDYTLDGSLFVGNMNGSQRPVVKSNSTGQVVVAMWARPQFTGAPGASSVNIFSDPNELSFFFYDIAYSYSEDWGVTWSAAEIAYSVMGEANYWPNIAEVETVGDVATVHFMSYYDEIPGTNVLGENSQSVGIWKYNTVGFNFTPIVSVENDGVVVDNFSLEQNYPNPFNPSTTIKYSVPEKGNVTIRVYDMLGAEVATLINVTQEAGSYEINFDASKLSSGIYIYRLNAVTVSLSKKMMLLK